MKRLQQLLPKTFKKKSVRLSEYFQSEEELMQYGMVHVNTLPSLVEFVNEYSTTYDSHTILHNWLENNTLHDTRKLTGSALDEYCPDETPQYFVFGLIIGALLLYGGLRYFKK